GGRNRGVPVVQGIGDAGHGGFTGNGQARIVDAVGHLGPAVVISGPDNVDFIATTGTVLVAPDFSGFRVQGHALNIPVAVGEEGVVETWLLNERIAGGGVPVDGNPMHATGIVAGVLGPVHLAAITHRNVQMAISTEHHPAGKVPRGVASG